MICTCLRNHLDFEQAYNYLTTAKDAMGIHDGDLQAQVDIVLDYLQDALHSVGVVDTDWKIQEFSLDDLDEAVIDVESCLNHVKQGFSGSNYTVLVC